MPVSAMSAGPDEATFRNGMPVRMTGWLNIKHTRLSRKLPRFAKLHGEVLSFHLAENRLPEEEFDLVGAHVEWSDRDSKKSFRLTIGRRTWICHCDTFEEMRTWAVSISFATTHSFHRYYTLGAVIAEGTMSRVYYAHALDDPSGLYAVKVIKKRADDVTAQEWVRRERHVNCVLNHPTIVQCVDMFSTVEKDHIVMELMNGGTLETLLTKHKRLPESYARVVMRELLTALNHLHAKNIVHRDVRPANVFCSDSKFPMSIALGDFGFSTFLQERTVNTDVLSTLIGVPPYIPVEVIRRQKYGPLADVWSAGVVLYEMLCGETPFVGKTDRQVYEKIKKGVVRFDQPIWKTISEDAKRLLKQLLQANPYKRISALAALQHPWMNPPSRTTSLNSAHPSAHSASAGAMGDRDSPGNTSTDSRRNGVNMPSSMSNFSRNSSSTTQPEPERTGSGSSERQTSLLGVQPSQRSMQHVSSISSLSGGPGRMQVTPSVRLITERGLQRVASDNPQRMKRLLSSSVVKMQLSMALPYRRKLIVTARAFVAVSRLKALAKGHCATRQMSVLGGENVDEIIEQRKQAMEKDIEQRKLNEERRKGRGGRAGDRRDGNPMPNNPRRGHHVRKRSREVASQIMGRLSFDRFSQDTPTSP